ncbi:MAG TPA: adenosylcobalamin-dependent ribonucleoside-diphosphate reductase [Candidatus Bipolaricaulota bacterium]
MAKPVTSAPEVLSTSEFFKGDELRSRCFLDKYALRQKDGTMVETLPPQMWQRIARAIASAEALDKQAEWERNFYWLLEDFRFVPGGRIMFGAGQPRNATLLNCYVLPIEEDSLEDIFDWCKRAARTYSYGGGVGTDISVLRPAGSPVNNSAMYSSGAVSFMELLSTTTGTIGQAGRRGALMITLSVDHPDVEAFIEIKNDPERRKVQYANISVRITDEFMRAVENDDHFTLGFENADTARITKKVKARQVWDKLVQNARDSAEPGLIFWDNVKKESTTEYNGMNVVTTNPCSEIPLEPYGCCCLGNVNLSQFVADPFTPQAQVDWPSLEQALGYSVRFLDNVLDYNADKHPLPEQKDASLKSRRIGVGFTGLGDMLIKLGYKYDSEEALEFADRTFERIKNQIHLASTQLAQEKGPFDAFDAEKHLQSPFIQRLDAKVKNRIKKHGIRNAALITVPPVGSGSVLAGTSSGVEPIFSLSYVRRSKSLSKGEFRVFHPLVQEYLDYRAEQGQPLDDESQLPDLFVTAHQIKPDMRVRMQAVIQKHVDHAISSTINLPRQTTAEEIKQIYMDAWKQGLKGITVYREGSREGILVTHEQAAREKGEKLEEKITRSVRAPRPRPKVVKGKTFRMKTELGSVYITVNEDESGPSEVFVQGLGKSGSSTAAFSEAIGRLLSLALRSGIKSSVIIDQLNLIRGSRPVFQEDGTVVFSVPDAIAKALSEYLKGGEQLPLLSGKVDPVRAEANGHEPKRTGELCPSCGGVLSFTNGCALCPDCGYSQCD